jgi:hypothetical protein
MTTREAPALRRFVRRAVEGMQRPPIFEADDESMYVLKLDTMDRDFPAAELVGAMLARAFDVPQPRFEVLRVPDFLVEFMVSTEDPDLAEFAASFTRLGHTCFGSRYLGGVLQKWTATLRAVVPHSDRLLAHLLVFDAFIENGDRTSVTNPNLLVSNARLYAIDHGQALPSVQGVRGKRLPYAFDSHIAWNVVREQPALLDAPVAALRLLSDAAITEAVRAVPPAWWTETGRDEHVIRDLCARRDALPAILLALKDQLA